MIRVQISGFDATASQYELVWGFDNASFLYRVDVLDSQTLRLRSRPIDAFHQPRANQAVEVLRSAAQLNNGEYIASTTGIVETLAAPYDPDTQQLTLPTALPSEYLDPSTTLRVFLRVWEEEKLFTPGTAVSLGTTGLEVTLQTTGGGPFHIGDYWLIAVRPSTPTQVYPQRYLQGPQPPDGPRLWVCPLAVIEWGDGILSVLEDCRKPFPPLTGIIGREPGIHIVDVKLMSGEPLRNDTNVPVNAFAHGIQIVCDAAVDQNTIIGKPTCVVTLDLPFPFNDLDRRLWGDPVIGFQPLILAANSNADGNIIFWAPAADTQTWFLDRLFLLMNDFKRGDRVLAHLTLKGNFIWSRDNPQLYLDGEVFGVRQPGQTNTDIDLRKGSGNGLRGGDFEMWFWLVAQPPAAKVISIDPPDGKLFRIIEGGLGDTHPSRVVVTFDKSLRADTVNEQTIQVMMFPDNDQPNALVAGTVIYNDTTKSAVFTPNQPFAAGGVNGFRYEVTVRGNGQDPILDVDGLALDGDGDGSPGGNATSQFTIIFIVS